jgi:origin recognition complex subunit 4
MSSRHALYLSPSFQNSIPTGKVFAQNALLAPESKLHILEGLSDLELSLLIAAARLDIVLDTDTCNFNMAYDEYQTLASRVKVQSSASGAAAIGAGSKIWGREVSLGAWEKLSQYELIVPAIGTISTTGGATGAGGGNGTKMWVEWEECFGLMWGWRKLFQAYRI